MTTIGTPRSAAMLATSACEPSPPAMPTTSAPRSMASRASWSRSSPALQHDRLDPARAALVHEVELLGLPAAGLEVHDQHAVARGRHRRARRLALLERAHVARQRVAREQQRDAQERQPHQQREHVALAADDLDDHDGDGRHDGDDDPDHARGALPRERVPHGEEDDEQQDDLHEHLERPARGRRARWRRGRPRRARSRRRRRAAARRRASVVRCVWSRRLPSLVSGRLCSAPGLPPATSCHESAPAARPRARGRGDACATASSRNHPYSSSYRRAACRVGLHAHRRLRPRRLQRRRADGTPPRAAPRRRPPGPDPRARPAAAR